MGNGYFGRLLGYKEWYEFQVAQRIHYNLLENIPFLVLTTIVTSIGMPRAGAALSGLNFLGRVLYCLGYKIGGPNLRLPGAAIAHFTTMILLFTSVFASANIASNGALFKLA